VVDRLAIDAALDELPEEFRAAVVLRDVADLDYAEIAEALGVPVGTVKSRIARGRGQLTALLGNRDRGGARPSTEGGSRPPPPAPPTDAP
jgi:RNA polymerase sigma-70 factor (ECF subfamily)